jgi:anti-anti-sigma factor
MTAGNALLEITRDSDSFRLSGELDLSNVDQLATTLSPEVRDGNHLVLDCSDLKFIDSTGMAALLAICKGLGPSGRLTLRTVPIAVAKAAHVLGLERVPNLELTDSRSAPGIAATA